MLLLSGVDDRDTLLSNTVDFTADYCAELGWEVVVPSCRLTEVCPAAAEGSFLSDVRPLNIEKAAVFFGVTL